MVSSYICMYIFEKFLFCKCSLSLCIYCYFVASVLNVRSYDPWNYIRFLDLTFPISKIKLKHKKNRIYFTRSHVACNIFVDVLLYFPWHSNAFFNICILGPAPIIFCLLATLSLFYPSFRSFSYQVFNYGR